jgi:hypothetical protein
MMRETPWGLMSYLEYRKRVEFWEKEYDSIDAYCKERGILWSVSCWDLPSLEFMKRYRLPFMKVPSALITHSRFLQAVKMCKEEDGLPLCVSTGMSEMGLVREVVSFLGEDRLVLMHTVSTYPAENREINLRVLSRFQEAFSCPVGYSGHEVGLQISLAAVALGARVVERHGSPEEVNLSAERERLFDAGIGVISADSTGKLSRYETIGKKRSLAPAILVLDRMPGQPVERVRTLGEASDVFARYADARRIARLYVAPEEVGAARNALGLPHQEVR